MMLSRVWWTTATHGAFGWGFRERRRQENTIGVLSLCFDKAPEVCGIKKSGRAGEDDIFVHHPRAKNRPSGRSRVISGLFLCYRTRDKADTSKIVPECLWKQEFSHFTDLSMLLEVEEEKDEHMNLLRRFFCFRSDTGAHCLFCSTFLKSTEGGAHTMSCCPRGFGQIQEDRAGAHTISS